MIPSLIISWFNIKNGNSAGNIVLEKVVIVFNDDVFVSFMFIREYIINIEKKMVIIMLVFFIFFTIKVYCFGYEKMINRLNNHTKNVFYHKLY